MGALPQALLGRPGQETNFERLNRKPGLTIAFVLSITEPNRCSQRRKAAYGKEYQGLPEPTRDEIAACAHQIYVSEGRPEGKAMEHWLQAEAQLIAEFKAKAGLFHWNPPKNLLMLPERRAGSTTPRLKPGQSTTFLGWQKAVNGRIGIEAATLRRNRHRFRGRQRKYQNLCATQPNGVQQILSATAVNLPDRK